MPVLRSPRKYDMFSRWSYMYKIRLSAVSGTQVLLCARAEVWYTSDLLELYDPICAGAGPERFNVRWQPPELKIHIL